MEAKEEYIKLKDMGVFDTLFPNLTGEWEKDKKEFIKEYNLNSEILGL